MKFGFRKTFVQKPTFSLKLILNYGDKTLNIFYMFYETDSFLLEVLQLNLYFYDQSQSLD